MISAVVATVGEAIVKVLAWLAPIVGLALLIAGMSKERERRRRRTDQEFAADVARARGSMLAAGAKGLEKAMGGNEKRAAIEYKKDEEEGTTRTGSKGDDADRTLNR